MAVQRAKINDLNNETYNQRWVQKLYEWSAKDKNPVDLKPQESSSQHCKSDHMVQYHPISYQGAISKARFCCPMVLILSKAITTNYRVDKNRLKAALP